MILEGQVALVTGASRGIGRAIALKLAGEGAFVVATATSETGALATVEAITAQNGTARAVKLDVVNAAEVESLVKAVIADHGRLDILVNNAGITKDGLLMRMKEDDWDAVLDTNLKGAFLCTREASKVMTKSRYGRIVNISSVVGEMGNPGQANYCASKAGMFGMTKSAARELAKRNITVNAVAPGFIETDMTSELSEKVRESLMQQIPLERLGSADDIANAVFFLVSPSSSYITGHVLSVNGGMYM
ncbi:3-oxoacyl-[acyl-carrier-protein] reductase [Pelotalea chapellei]|uniref:3-oxoacyl-[acyl-carrier-protein] reductase n=1 Tax=Pelotalea chapellei TaxID=44671 RepID=A0ABS5U7G8_9BACT|nr:3-oxoacyl-[acyl-carrier-protein] reductase [Pelotalea chapellei]MBT1071610.1 3-oxoacyl-[acyl-carrier-protein] reductase [Pelotalea chapellei]